jgi:hypothetical protein
VTLLEGAKVAALEPAPAPDGGPGLTAVLEDGARIGGTHLLIAAGRVPRLRGSTSRRGASATRRGGS